MWTMPRSVLSVVAVLIGVCAVAGFVFGLGGTPENARLPGETEAGAKSSTPLVAADALPLDETPPPPPKVEEKEEVEIVETAPEPEPPPPVVAPPPQAPTPPPSAAPPPSDQVGDLIDGVTPQEEPPF
jgi:hypothetical protein